MPWLIVQSYQVHIVQISRLTFSLSVRPIISATFLLETGRIDVLWLSNPVRSIRGVCCEESVTLIRKEDLSSSIKLLSDSSSRPSMTKGFTYSHSTWWTSLQRTFRSNEIRRGNPKTVPSVLCMMTALIFVVSSIGAISYATRRSSFVKDATDVFSLYCERYD